MRRLRIGVIDTVTRGPNRSLYARVMHANFGGIMPQIVATWCEQDGHDVRYVCYTGLENLVDELPRDVDLVFISAFTQCAQLAYALSNLFRSQGAVTVLGGPHARCYPQDACRYFDYVVGFTDRTVVREILRETAPHRPIGVQMAANKQPAELPGVRERWRFIEQTLKKAPIVKIVPVLGSVGCPYSCSFCIDANVPYQLLDLDVLKDDLRFLRTKFRRPHVGWHDPNFGIRFDDFLDAIEEAVPPDSIDFIAETSLAVLTEDRVRRLKRNGFKGLMPGIESWYSHGNKSKTGSSTGEEKVELVSEHVNMLLRYIPFVQTNFVVGMDVDEGPEPFELTKRFLDNAPAAFPAYCLLTAFGQAAPLNLEYQRAGRILPFPFHFLNNHHAMNVRPKNYAWRTFYDHVIDLSKYSFSWRAVCRRTRAIKTTVPRWYTAVRALSSEGGRIRWFNEVRRRLDSDEGFSRYFEGETTELPEFFLNRVRNDLGPLWDWLPQGALHHDAHAYMKSVAKPACAPAPAIGGAIVVSPT